jgi:hypothetical protein
MIDFVFEYPTLNKELLMMKEIHLDVDYSVLTIECSSFILFPLSFIFFYILILHITDSK